jgi:hypothetical protein
MAQQPSWPRLIGSGLAAGAVINLCEWGVHAVWLDDAWREAFAVLGKTPTGWSTFIPANFWVFKDGKAVIVPCTLDLVWGQKICCILNARIGRTAGSGGVR